MTQVQAGQRYRDNDPRMAGRILEVVSVDPVSVGARARCKDSIGHIYKILVSRMHTDRKARKSGFSLIQEPEPRR